MYILNVFIRSRLELFIATQTLCLYSFDRTILNKIFLLCEHDNNIFDLFFQECQPLFDLIFFTFIINETKKSAHSIIKSLFLFLKDFPFEFGDDLFFELFCKQLDRCLYILYHFVIDLFIINMFDKLTYFCDLRFLFVHFPIEYAYVFVDYLVSIVYLLHFLLELRKFWWIFIGYFV